MALSTYADLKTLVQSRLHRNDVAALVDDFVKLAEVRLNREIQVPQKEVIATGAMAATIAIPSDLLALRYVGWVDANARKHVLTPLATEALMTLYSGTTPEGYVVLGSDIYVLPATTTGTYEIGYEARWDIASTGTNWLLTNFPDAYLYATLIEAAQHTRDSVVGGEWTTFYVAAKNGIEEVNRRTRYAGPLTVREG